MFDRKDITINASGPLDGVVNCDDYITVTKVNSPVVDNLFCGPIQPLSKVIFINEFGLLCSVAEQPSLGYPPIHLTAKAAGYLLNPL